MWQTEFDEETHEDSGRGPGDRLQRNGRLDSDGDGVLVGRVGLSVVGWERYQPVDPYEALDARSVFPNIRGRRPFPKIRRPSAPETDRRNIPAISDRVYRNGRLGMPVDESVTFGTETEGKVA